jgi:hypothetical protein
MRRKLGRNDPCWCGSGLKYKKCHMDREKQDPLDYWDAVKRLRTVFSAKDCLAPPAMKSECTDEIVRAHTIPKSESLRLISRDGHVYSFVPDPENIRKHGGKLKPQLLGINSASTFTGFCSNHDNSIFSKIEKEPFRASQEQCFLLAYRSFAREIFTKKALVSSLDITRQADRGKPQSEQYAIQFKNYAMYVGASAALKDNDYYKPLMDNILISKDFSDIRAYVIELVSPPPVMCSSSIYPYRDFNDNILQDIANLESIPHLLGITSFSSGKRGFIVFTWLNESGHACQTFIDSFRKLPSSRITDGLIRFFFTYSENVHINPDWWGNLDQNRRDSLVERLFVSASLDPALADSYGRIADDGIMYDTWTIAGTKTIGF